MFVETTYRNNILTRSLHRNYRINKNPMLSSLRGKVLHKSKSHLRSNPPLVRFVKSKLCFRHTSPFAWRLTCNESRSNYSLQSFIFITASVLFIMLPLFSFAQQTVEADTTLHIKEVVVSDLRLVNFSTGTHIQSFDSAALGEYKQDNLAEFLFNETGIFIKTYGLGSLATSSFRGGSANHTLALWNGFNINSPMNGILDFSLVPAGLSNDIKIQHGGTSALWGGGAIGGAIHLNSVPVFDRGVTASASFEAGSFSTFSERLTLDISKSRWVSGLKFSHNTAKNNFPFRNYFLPESPEVRQSNNELNQYSALWENFFIINKKQKLNVFFWYQNTDRNIPPTMLQATSQASQQDESFRVTSEWQFSEKKKQ